MGDSPNLFAYLVLILSVPLAVIVVRFTRPGLGAALVAVGASLFLPESVGFDIPGLPDFEKMHLPYIGILVGACFRAPGRLASARPGGRDDAIVILLVVAAMATWATNTDPLVSGPYAGTRLTIRDGISMVVSDVLLFGIPFFVGRALFRKSQDIRDLMIVLVGAGLVYAVLIVWEAQMSPQLHRNLYGYHPEFFGFVHRWGGFRPRVFLRSGLAVGMFSLAVTLAAVGCWHARVRIMTLSAGPVAVFLTGILVLCKSTGAIVYGLFLIPAAALFRAPSLLARVAILLAVLTFAYPLLRTLEWFPTDTLTQAAERLDSDRARSLAFRFENEDILLDYSFQRPVFGWGRHSRNVVFDPVTEDNTVVDGYWIIQLSSRGFVGWAGLFLLLLWPVFRTPSSLHRIDRKADRILLANLSLIVAIYSVDLLPNGLFTNLPVFLAGALSGLVRGLPSAGRGGSRRPPRRVSSDSPRERTPPRAGGLGLGLVDRKGARPARGRGKG